MAIQLPQLVIIGAGNLAWHLAFGLKKHFQITVFNHRKTQRFKVFEEMGCRVTTRKTDLPEKPAYCLICVPDKSIQNTLAALPFSKSTIVAHTSGGAELKLPKHMGVFYPLQTFTAGTPLLWKDVPLFITSREKKTRHQLAKLAQHLGAAAAVISDKERYQMHLAAVFASNFINSLLVVANELSGKNFAALRPLMLTTIQKTATLSPLEAQTGPAKRNDHSTMRHHLRLLKKQKNLQALYKSLSTLIAEQQKDKR
jgi:predicted short-subunit dehydrogenase-like oxidoreductase (DUF2520 family)